MNFNKISTDQTHIVALVAATPASVSFHESGQSGEVRSQVCTELTLVNTSSGDVYFRYDGKDASGAAGNDRVLLPTERLVLHRNVNTVSLYAAANATVEVTFSV